MLTSQIRTRPTARIEIPLQFLRLRDMAYNLWWTWSPRAHRLFHSIDPQRWVHYRNPIELLVDMEPERWQRLQADPDFIRAYREMIERFDLYVAPDEPTWFERAHPGYAGGPIAYFSTEFGWHECLQIYSGGLGVLSGDHTKAASDLGLPFVGVGLMYKHGYFRQTVDADGQQQHFYPDYDLHRVPLRPVMGPGDKELQVGVPFPDRTVRVRVWKADVGRVPVLLLDTDVPQNDPADRPITSILYIRGREMRLCQEIVLGLGGYEVLRALGIEPSIWHMNEGHSALLSLARLRETMRENALSFEEALRAVSRNTVFTTHTPVPAGNESFDADLVRRYFAGWAESAGIDLEALIGLGRAHEHDLGSFNMTALALRSSERVNGVSELHGRIADEMWGHLPTAHGKRSVEHVTNGVHLPTWLGPELGGLLRERLGAGFEYRVLNGGFADAVRSTPDHELWRAHREQKSRLIGFLRNRVRHQWARHGRSPGDLRRLDGLFDPEVLVVGFARRFATYKRADLLLADFERFKRIACNAERPVQFVFAGKAHPADRPGQDLIRRIWEATQNPELQGRLLFVENYDMRIGRFLVQGVDLWLNNPTRPMEASGTSGMKAAINGGLNCSVLDGWWCEGYDPSHGWTIGPAGETSEGAWLNDGDADSLYRLFEEEIVPCYYQRDESGLPREWIARMKEAIATLSPQFCTQRMVQEYVERFYLPAGVEVKTGA
jgi:starch phosphorylase